MKTVNRNNSQQAHKADLEQQTVDLMKRCRLTHWTAFTETVNVPQDISIALMTNRAELLALARPRDMTAAEVAPLYKLIRVLFETNQALREHAENTARLTNNWMSQFKGIAGVAGQIDRFANFQEPRDDDEG